jgi:hypothetical protein
VGKLLQSTRRNNPEDSHLHTHRREKIKSHIYLFYSTTIATAAAIKFSPAISLSKLKWEPSFRRIVLSPSSESESILMTETKKVSETLVFKSAHTNRTAQHRRTKTNIHALTGIRTQDPSAQNPRPIPRGHCDQNHANFGPNQ